MISLLISIPAILILIATVLICMARGVKKSVIRLLTVLISFFVSIPVAQAVAKKLSGIVSEMLMDLLGSDGVVAEIFAASPTLSLAPEALAAVLAAPVLYLVTFIVMALLMLIVHKILTVVLKKLPDFESKALSRGLGAAVGLVVALVIIIGIYAPISGYVALADGIVAKAELEAPDYLENVPSIALDAVSASADAIPVKVSDALGGKALFKGLTTGKLNGEKFSLASELDIISDVGLAATAFISTDIAEYGDDQISAIETVEAGVVKSLLLNNIVPELLSGAATSWSEGKDFAGMAKPSIGEQFDPLLNEILKVFTTSDKNNIATDLDTIGKLFSVAIDKKVLSNTGNSEELIKIFSNADTVKALTTTLGANQRMKHLVPTITNIGLTIVYSSLGIPETNADIEAQFVASLVVAINECSDLEFEEMADELSYKFDDIVKEYALDVSESEIDAIAIGLAYDFSGLENITQEDVQSFLDIYAEYINADSSDITSVPVPANVIRAIAYTGEETEPVEGIRIMFANADTLENTATDAYDGVILTADKNSVTVKKGKITGAQLAAQLAKGVKAEELPEETLDEKTKEVYKKSEEKHKETREEPNLYKVEKVPENSGNENEGVSEGENEVVSKKKLSTRIPTQDEMVWSGEDIPEETYEKLGEVVAKAAEVVSSTDFTNIDITGIASSIGGILDGIAEISEEMKEISDNLVKGALITVKDQALPDVPTSTIIDIADGLISLTKTEEPTPEDKPATPDAPAVTTTAVPVTTNSPVSTAAPVTTGKPGDAVEPAVTTTVPAATTTVAPVTTAKPAATQKPATYEDMFGSAGKVIGYMQILNGNGDMEEKKATIDEMVDNLDSTLAGVLEAVINEELVLAYGLPEDMAKGLVNPLKKMFKKLAKEEITAMDREAVNLLLNMAYYTPGSYTHAFNHGNEVGALGVSASYLAGKLDKSHTVADGCIDILNKFSDALLGKMSDLDREALSEAAVDCEYKKLQNALEKVVKKSEHQAD